MKEIFGTKIIDYNNERYIVHRIKLNRSVAADIVDAYKQFLACGTIINHNGYMLFCSIIPDAEISN